MQHDISCACGRVKGQITNPRPVNRVICYCTDCRAFAEYLDCKKPVLDARGGTDIVQLPIDTVSFIAGTDQIKCLRLTPKGLMRWHSGCCNTPLGNVMPGRRAIGGIVGIPVAALDAARLSEDFGPVRCVVHGDSALHEPKPKNYGLPGTIRRILVMMVRAGLGKTYDRSPFSPDGKLIARPEILGAERSAKA